MLAPQTTRDSFLESFRAFKARAAIISAPGFKLEDTEVLPPIPLIKYAKTAACSEGLIIPLPSAFEPETDITDSKWKCLDIHLLSGFLVCPYCPANSVGNNQVARKSASTLTIVFAFEKS